MKLPNGITIAATAKYITNFWLFIVAPYIEQTMASNKQTFFRIWNESSGKGLGLSRNCFTNHTTTMTLSNYRSLAKSRAKEKLSHAIALPATPLR